MTLPFDVQVSSAARRQLQRLPDEVAVAIVEFFTAVLPENPLRRSKALTGDLTGLRSARRGDYRILIQVDEHARAILGVRIAHRADAYRPPAPSVDRGSAPTEAR